MSWGLMPAARRPQSTAKHQKAAGDNHKCAAPGKQKPNNSTGHFPFPSPEKERFKECCGLNAPASPGERRRKAFQLRMEAALTAGLILLALGPEALSVTNPYLASTTQTGFATFGAPHILDFVVRAARATLTAAWFQKWLVHRRARPEEFGGAIHSKLTGAADYPIADEVLNSKALAQVFGKYGSYLLPQGYPEGSPAHPAYPSGHAAMIGAGATMLKAFFKESYILPAPVMASTDGCSLVPYSGGDLTIGGELNKLAANIVMGHNFAGIHWRSDNTAGLQLGEAIAISILQDYRYTYHEKGFGFSFTKLDGTPLTI